jgi:hypothetical protein
MRNGKRSKSNLKILLFLIFVLSEISFAQQYPVWLINQGDISCKGLTVGYARRSYYGDTSAVKYAVMNAAENYVKLSSVSIAGDQNFWATAIGNAWMGSSFKESYDSGLVSKVAEEIKIIDTYKLNDYLIVLTSKDECDLLETEKNLVLIAENSKPTWLANLPNNENYFYAIGSSENYHYSETSWLAAEKNARLVLARSLSSKTKAVQRFSNTENQAIVNESISMQLNDLEIANRWIDSKLKLFYVLIRCRKFS